MNKSWAYIYECIYVWVNVCMMIMLFSSLASMPSLVACILSYISLLANSLAVFPWHRLLFVMIYVRNNIPMRLLYLSLYAYLFVCACVFCSCQNHLTQFIDCAFILFYWSSFNFPTLVVLSWMQSIDGIVLVFFTALFQCLCSTWKKEHPTLHKQIFHFKYLIYLKKTWMVKCRFNWIAPSSSAAAQIHIRTYHQRKYTNQLNKIVFDLCVEFSPVGVWLHLQPE